MPDTVIRDRLAAIAMTSQSNNFNLREQQEMKGLITIKTSLFFIMSLQLSSGLEISAVKLRQVIFEVTI